jgi:hypothetical protein
MQVESKQEDNTNIFALHFEWLNHENILSSDNRALERTALTWWPQKAISKETILKKYYRNVVSYKYSVLELNNLWFVWLKASTVVVILYKSFWVITRRRSWYEPTFQD